MMLQARSLSGIAGIAHGFFGRRGGVSEGVFSSLNVSLRNADDFAAAWTNRSRIAAQFGGTPERLHMLRQVHGTEVIEPHSAFDPHDPPQGDALVSTEPGAILGVTTADCAPLIIAEPAARVVGAAHAGWRGALDGIGERLVEAMVARGGDRRAMVAAIGPCIGQDSYEVGEEFEARFCQHDPANARFFVRPTPADRPHFDIAGFLAARLRAAGVTRVEILAADTAALASDYFSYRRSCLAGERHFGLQLSAIVLT